MGSEPGWNFTDSALAGLTPDEAYAGAAHFSTDAKKQKQKKQRQQKLAA
jgi:hypothetical protein